MDGIITVWVITWRTVWPAMLAALLLPLAALLARRRVDLAPVVAFALPIIGPLSIVVWSGLSWAAETHATSGIHWASNVLTALVLMSLTLIIGIAVRYRRSPRYWTVLLTALTNVVFVLAAGFVGSMAISNTWM